MRFACSFLLAVFAVATVGHDTKVYAMQSSATQAVFELRDGSEIESKIVSVDSQSVVIESAGETKTLSPDSINKIRLADVRNEPSELAHCVQLVDGSKLFCPFFKVSDRVLSSSTECDISVEVSSRLLDFVRFPNTGDDFIKSWDAISKQQRESDALVVSRDQKLQMVDGIIGDVAAESVSFTVGDRTADVKRNRLSGLLFYRRTTTEFSPAVAALKLIDGSLIEVQSLVNDNGQLKVRSVAGASFLVRRDSVFELDFSLNREMWLTDLEPATNDWVPLLAGSNIVNSLRTFSIARMNKSFSGKPLAILNRGEGESWKREESAKGFAIKGGGKLSFLLANQFQRLTGSIAFDPDTNSAGLVKLMVQVDGVSRVEQILDASKMERPFQLDIDLANAQRLVFEVKYHDRRSVGDILHAVDLKLAR